jgi:hypothetical protein
VAPPLLRHPQEVVGLRQRVDAAQPEDQPEIFERDRRRKLGIVDRRADAGIDDARLRAVSGPEVPGLGHGGYGYRGEIGHQLGILATNRLRHRGVGGADHGAPVFLIPQPLIFGRHQLVADDAAIYGPVARRVAGVDHLFRGGRVEVGRGLGAQSKNPVARGRYRQGSPDLAGHLDGVVGTGGDTLAATDTRVVDDPHGLTVDRHRRRGAHPDARETRDTGRSVDSELQRPNRLEREG